MPDKYPEQLQKHWENFQAVFKKVAQAYAHHPEASTLRAAIPTQGTYNFSNVFGVTIGEGDDAKGVSVSVEGVQDNEILEQRIHEAIRELLNM